MFLWSPCHWYSVGLCKCWPCWWFQWPQVMKWLCCFFQWRSNYLVNHKQQTIASSTTKSQVLTIYSNNVYFRQSKCHMVWFQSWISLSLKHIIFNITSFINPKNVDPFIFNMFQHMIKLPMFLPRHYMWIKFSELIISSHLDPRIINEHGDLTEHWPLYNYDNEWECCFSLNCFTLYTYKIIIYIYWHIKILYIWMFNC
jgi:hypothetical protein